MSEDASIRRLRRLMGNQKFEEEALRGKLAHEREIKEQTERQAELRTAAEQARNSIQGRPAQPAVTGKKLVPRTSMNQSSEADNPGLPSTEAPNEVTKSEVPAKRRRSRVKQSPYSDTESETDTDEERWAFDQEAGPEMAFCPILAANKYPYKYILDKGFSEQLAHARWNNGQFFRRNWTIFYIHPPDIVSPVPIYFVPASEVQTLFQEVSQELGRPCDFPIGPAAAGFKIVFTPNEPRPRYLGVSSSREEYDAMSRYVPASADLKGAWSISKPGDDRSFKAWQLKLEESLLAAKQKKAKSKAQAQNKRVASRQQWCRQLRRSQRYLGLRAPNAKEAKGACTKTQDEIDDLLKANAIEESEQPPVLDIDKPPQFAFDEDVVFVSIDIEAHETMHSMITEVGIATLDTRDLKSVAPGAFAKDWRSLIKYRHFRINEFRHHVNNKHISGCPDRFEKSFGQSEFIFMSEIPKVVAMTCKSPFPVTAADRAAVEGSNMYNDQAYEPRKIVLVGHDFDGDVDYLKRAGVAILQTSGLIEVLDTSMIHRALIHEQNPTSLGSVLSACSIEGWNLHNAGNDAGYTLQALLAMAVEHLHNQEHRALEEKYAVRRETAIRLAGEREDSDFQEWLIADRGVTEVAGSS